MKIPTTLSLLRYFITSSLRVLLTFMLLLQLFSCQEKVEVIEDTFDDGSPKRVVIYEMADNKQQKLEETVYHDNGMKKIAGKYEEGKRTGKWESFHPNGALWSVGHYEKGLREGEAVVYYPSGKIHYRGIYKNDEAVGMWQFYDEQGNLIKEMEYGKEK